MTKSGRDDLRRMRYGSKRRQVVEFESDPSDKEHRPPPPRVFISYSQESEEHSDRVLGWANQLRSEGIDVRLDRYEPHPAEGWPQWMQTQVTESDFVLLVCTPTYRERFEGKVQPDEGQGVQWEGRLAQQVLYSDGSRNERFIPVLLAGGTVDDIPLSLKAFSRYRVPEDHDALYRRLTGQPDVVVPELGPVRVLPPRTSPASPVKEASAHGASHSDRSPTSNIASDHPPRRALAPGARVYVSSVLADNPKWRSIVSDSLISSGMVVVSSDRLTAGSHSIVEGRIEQVQSCHCFVGLIAHRYGTIPPGQERSLIEIEYDAAKAAGLPCLMFLLDPSVAVRPDTDFDEGKDRWDKQQQLDRLKQRIRREQTPTDFHDDNLGAKVMQAILQERGR